MKKLILHWLFGVDNIDDYLTVLIKHSKQIEETIKQIESHLKTLDEEKEHITIIRKLIKVCENHGIDVDEEIKNVEL
jgi:hypothetical protein